MLLTFEQAVADLAGNNIPLDEFSNGVFDDQFLLDDDKYQFEFIKSVTVDPNDSSRKIPGVLRLDMDGYNEVDSDLQKVGFDGLLSKQTDEQFVLALSIPSGVELEVSGADLNLFHNNISGDDNRGRLIVKDYQGQEINGVGGSLESIAIEISHQGLVQFENGSIDSLPKLDNAPNGNARTIDLFIKDGSTFHYTADEDPAKLAPYVINAEGNAQLVVDADQARFFSFGVLAPTNSARPTVELVDFDDSSSVNIPTTDFAAVAQVSTISLVSTPTLTEGSPLTVEVNGQSVTTTLMPANPTDGDALSALATAITAVAGMTADVDSGVVKVTSTTPGIPFTIDTSADSALSNQVIQLTPNSVTPIVHAVIGSEVDTHGNATSTPSVTLDAADLANVDKLSVASGGTLTIDNAVNQILEQANTWINQHQSRISLVDTNLSVTPYTTHFVVWYSLNEGVDALDGEQPYGE